MTNKSQPLSALLAKEKPAVLQAAQHLDEACRTNDCLSNGMSNLMEYKGYLGTVEHSAADQCWFGKVFGIRDLVNYEASTEAELEAAFQAAIDDYLADRA